MNPNLSHALLLSPHKRKLSVAFHYYWKSFQKQYTKNCLYALFTLFQCIIIIDLFIYISWNASLTTNTTITTPQTQPQQINNLIKSTEKIVKPEKKYSTSNDLYKDYGNTERIFIAIASYRDNECVETILHAFEQSKYPERLRFGVFQQHNITDYDCTDFYRFINCEESNKPLHKICGRFWQVKVSRELYLDAKGPLYARYRTELFYQNEEFFLQIDAHSRFIPNWDNTAIDMFYRANNEYGVFTTYPKAYRGGMALKAPTNKDAVVVICNTKMNRRNKMFKHERGLDSKNPGHSVLGAFFAAGFSFSRGHRITNVSSDPYLPFVFDGEEILMGVRMWTNGYDLYVPDRDIIYHIYSNEYHKLHPIKDKPNKLRNMFWDYDNIWKDKVREKAQLRILYILGLFDKFKPKSWYSENDIDMREINKYSLGTERDINDFWKFIEMDFDKYESPCHRQNILNDGLKRVKTKSELLQSK